MKNKLFFTIACIFASCTQAQEISITNKSNERIWVNVDSQSKEKKFLNQSLQEIKLYNVLDYKAINPKETVTFKTKPSDVEGMGKEFNLTFIKIEKQRPLMIAPSALDNALKAYIEPLTKKYGIIWQSSSKGYSLITAEGKSEHFKAAKAQTDVPGNWLKLEIPQFDMFRKQISHDKTIISYNGWKNVSSKAAPKKMAAPVVIPQIQPIPDTLATPKIPKIKKPF